MVSAAEEGPDSEEVEDLSAVYKESLTELNQFSLYRAKGAQVRSRSRWVEEDESFTAYFFRLERKRKAESTISSLKVDDRVAASTSRLLSAASDFYKNLYSVSETDPVVQDDLLFLISRSTYLRMKLSCVKGIFRSLSVLKHFGAWSKRPF